MPSIPTPLPAGVPELFVYGLLRPGERYWPDIAPSVASRQPARIRGGLYRHGGGVYPLLDLSNDGWVHGDLLTVHDTDTVRALVFMELTARYEARWVEVFPSSAADPMGWAVAFSWPWGEQERGERIATGDWQHRTT